MLAPLLVRAIYCKCGSTWCDELRPRTANPGTSVGWMATSGESGRDGDGHNAVPGSFWMVTAVGREHGDNLRFVILREHWIIGFPAIWSSRCVVEIGFK